jgi:hypothetical protein
LDHPGVVLIEAEENRVIVGTTIPLAILAGREEAKNAVRLVWQHPRTLGPPTETLEEGAEVHLGQSERQVQVVIRQRGPAQLGVVLRLEPASQRPGARF